MRPQLPYIDLKNFRGLYTKSSTEVIQAQQLRVAQNCDFFNVYGAFSKILGNSRILSATYKENSVAEPITWIQFYKAADLTGAIDRQILVAAGTILGKIDSGAITTLTTGRTSDLFHTSTQLGRFMYITNQDPDKVGVGDDPVKYDGAVISRWGVLAPGSEETVLENFNDFSAWTAHNTDVFNDTTVTIDGGTSLRLVKDFYDRIFSIEKNFDQPFYVTSDARNTDLSTGSRIKFWTYIPPGQLTKDTIRTSSFDPHEAAMAVWLSPDTDTVLNAHWKFYFQIGDIVEGWNNLTLNFSGSPQGQLNFYPDSGNRVKRVRFDFRAEAEQDTIQNIRVDRFFQLDEGTPIPNPFGVGTFSGEYSYRITYVSKYGNESNAGPPSITVVTDNAGQINLSRIPTSTDPQVTARRLYRTVAGGSIWLFLDTIPNNTQTNYIDTTPDGSLGTTTPPQAGDFSDDNSPPPNAGLAVRWKRTIFMAGDPQNPTTLYFSEDDAPESFPLLNAFELDDKITAIYPTYSVLIVETETSKWQIIGDNPDFSLDKVVDNVGCVGRRAAEIARLVGYSIDRDGLRLFDGNDMAKISEPIRDKYVDDINRTNIELIHTGHSREKNSILQFNPDSTTPLPKYNSIFHYMYAIDDVRQGYWSEISMPSDINILDTTEIEDSNGDFKLYAAGEDGMVYELFAAGANSWVNASGTKTAIDTVITTPYLRVGEAAKEVAGASGRVIPRFVEVRLKDATAINWDVTIESADGPSAETPRDSQTLTLAFAADQSLVRQSLSPSFAGGEYFRVTLENNEVDTFAVVTGIRIYFQVRPFEGQKL